jgi:cyclohexadienyl dehydratase
MSPARIRKLAGCALALIALSACVAPRAATPPSSKVSATPAPRSVLRVGTSFDYAPFSKAGEGFDVEVAERMAADLGYRVEWVRFDWPDLQDHVAQDAFDVGMSGITWRPERSVIGYMTRAVAVGGPCLLSRAPVGTVAVNRGGILERWARERFDAAQLRVVSDNLALPALLERGEVDAIVTDSFELAHFTRPGLHARCEPPRDRKVYWVSPARAAELGPRIDAWLAEHEPQLAVLRARWLAREEGWSDVLHLVDLLARRLSLMPAVGAYKRAHGLPIEDTAREAEVLAEALSDAEREGLDAGSVRALFVEQIALAKAVQARTPDAVPMDLDGVLRPELSRLGARILAALARCAGELPELRPEQLDLLAPLLEPEELARMLAALRAVRPAAP